ncbi:MAG: bifunctional folylpolyglutamate synthase/dihydrofolate synthase [Sulfurovum sp.]|uniref:bifunctional folylpolyglutamate synthase/dihydrofolate synthase n=1 Tax=Sulfurovum sp. TaxID=1969726 RepID=UPI00286830A0|nr:bifunctional folylpolyglutamate synthase/dihydrofolate synthase [Sulfurovum sp.]MCO4844867.1 bifunctional folylpolyglutamate synthase/dihydrofolate synthase [Sulfurovum sp.]
MMQPFDRFLEDKPLYYKEIDHERVHSAYGLLKPHIRQPRTIHVVGTNGKGSTGRMIAHLAHKNGLTVGHFSSPHILKFNERIWMNGNDSTDEVLEEGHQKLFTILGKEMSEKLSYFEYTTLLAFVVFEDCDLMVLEAGLGGEFDATNVCDKALSVITPIGIDHQAFLGESIEEIAGTKIRSIQKELLLAPQVYDEVLEIAQKIADEKGAKLHLSLCPSHRMTELEVIAQERSWGDYLIDNACVALQALDILDISYDLNDLRSLELFGRFYPLTEKLRIDVGHNPLAAKAIVKALDEKVVLIYNSLDDKDYEAVLQTLKPKVKRVEIIPIHSQRATTLSEIEKALEKVGIEYGYFESKLDKDEHYLVFGSFYVIEEFLNKMQKKLNVPK